MATTVRVQPATEHRPLIAQSRLNGAPPPAVVAWHGDLEAVSHDASYSHDDSMTSADTPSDRVRIAVREAPDTQMSPLFSPEQRSVETRTAFQTSTAKAVRVLAQALAGTCAPGALLYV